MAADTRPEVPTETTDGTLLAQVPPELASVNETEEPVQMDREPTIGDNGLTVTTTFLAQPPAMVYVMDAVPAETPDTIPEAAPTVANATSAVAQVPPIVASPKVDVVPTHAVCAPVMGSSGLTVTTVVA